MFQNYNSDWLVLLHWTKDIDKLKMIFQIQSSWLFIIKWFEDSQNTTENHIIKFFLIINII